MEIINQDMLNPTWESHEPLPPISGGGGGCPFFPCVIDVLPCIINVCFGIHICVVNF
ncbi:MAG: hypothetical protein FWD82_09265 [Defluviitaleaceae bacterium]|nr:hypothetical protein [Defluviitaleaceae bacterium]